MILENLTAGPIGAYIVTGLFIITIGFFILNELGLVRKEEIDEKESELEDRKV